MRALVVSVVMLGSAAAWAAPCGVRPKWPTDEWPIHYVDSTAKQAAIKELEDFAFTLDGADSERKGLRTDSLLIIKHGEIIYERYGRGFDETKRHISWSVAKSFSSALVGIATFKAGMSLDDSICTWLPEFVGRPQCAITVRDAITFGTGLDWQEEYENATYQVSSVIAMLYGVGHRNQLAHIVGHRMAAAHAERWNYSTGDAELASALARRALEKRFGKDAFWKVLFEPIGMKRVVLEEDAQGTPQGGSMLYATPRDFAKFGFLFLNGGCWDGQRIVPEGWVESSTVPSDVYTHFSADDETTASGYAWWLNAAIPSLNRPSPWPDIPADTYAALGHWGQRIVVVPSQDVIVVRTGDDRQGSVNVNELVKRALEVAR